jgi:hypothetical protein
VHQFVLLDVNAPDPATGQRPLSNIYGTSNVFQYTSEAVYRQNQMIANFRVNMGQKLSLFGFYSLNFANSNTNGPNSVPLNSFDLSQDYGRSVFDIRQRLVVGGSISLPYAFRLNPFMIVNSGTPYNVYVGEDLNGDSILTNDRPGFADPSACSAQSLPSGIVSTSLGCFTTNVNSLSPNLIPVNNYTAPAQVTFNLRVSRTFGFGPKVQGTSAAGPRGGGPGGGGGGGRGGRGAPGGGLGPAGLSGAGGNHPPGMDAPVTRRYSLTLSASARNLFNHVNPGIPIANLSVPEFGTFNSLAGGPFSQGSANRRIDFQMRFQF